MNRRLSLAHSHKSASYERAIAALACQAQMPIEYVAQLCARELAVLTAGAHISDFLPILTIRRVRALLRQPHHAVHELVVSAPQESTVHGHVQDTA